MRAALDCTFSRIRGGEGFERFERLGNIFKRHATLHTDARKFG